METNPINPLGVASPDLASALRRGAAGHTTRAAAVELLVAHGHWLGSPTIRERIDYWPADGIDPAIATVRWSEIETALAPDSGVLLFGSSSELGLLRLAVSLASGWLGDALASLDRYNTALVITAVERAGGGR